MVDGTTVEPVGRVKPRPKVVQELFAEGYLARTHEAVAINSTAGFLCASRSMFEGPMVFDTV